MIQEQFQTSFSAMPPMAEPQPTDPLVYQVELVRKLISTMMVGQMHCQFADVAHIFRTLTSMLGDGRHLRISLALASAIGGNVQPARDLLKEGMDDWPDAEAAKVSVATALKMGGDPEWIHVCKQTLAVSNDDDARRFAQQLLEQADQS